MRSNLTSASIISFRMFIHGKRDIFSTSKRSYDWTHSTKKKSKQTKKPKAGKWDLISFFDIYPSAILDNNNEAMGERLILRVTSRFGEIHSSPSAIVLFFTFSDLAKRVVIFFKFRMWTHEKRDIFSNSKRSCDWTHFTHLASLIFTELSVKMAIFGFIM